VRDLADGVIVNAGAWSHYSRAIGDALQFAAVPAVEVHLSDVMRREPWRHVSVLSESCIATISGKGVAGYREAFAALKAALVNAPPRDATRS
jgi:3-dehydroquinate dehydratase-2